MPFTLDPEVAAAFGTLLGGQPVPPPAPLGDVLARRERFEAMLDMTNALAPVIPDVTTQDFYTTTDDGHALLLRWFTKTSAPPPGSAILYAHGGGMIAFSLRQYDPVLKRLVSETGVPFLAVEYRLAPEVRAPVPVMDVYAGLVYLHAHAAEWGVDPARIAIMGDSAGGGIAASVAHHVKRRAGGGPALLARQILAYPMLDDRNTRGDDVSLAPFAFWKNTDNATSWGALLGEQRVGAPDVTVLEAAGRMTVADAEGLPPAYIDVGELDIFRDEDVEYARTLGKAGVSCEFHLIPGVPHAFETIAPEARVSKFIMEQRMRVIKSV